MASKIIYEDDFNLPNIDTTNEDNLNQDVTIKEENNAEKGNNSPKNIDTEDLTQKNNNQPDNVQENTETPNNSMGKLSQKENVMVNICHLNGEGNTNPKGKKRLRTELELLGIDIKQMGNDEPVGDYDVYGDDNKIFKKYKLRKTEQQISYKEPKNFKLKLHYSSEDEPDSLICSICDREFENKRAFQLHSRIHLDSVKVYTCSLCSDKFNTNSELIAHRSVHRSESFLCKQCKLAFSEYCDYLLHKHVHMVKPRFQCPECGLNYKKGYYRSHVLTHFDKKVKCPICPFETNGEFNLRSHINQHNYKLTCVECGKVLKNKAVFDYHMSMHTGVKKFQCLYCGKCFRHNHAREVHTRIHTGEKPFTCDICGYKARQWIDLKRHKETHDSEKKFACEICGKKYLHKDYLALHLRSHTKKNLYDCPECDREFISVAGLKTHIMFKHTNERPVECTLCNKKFINKNQYSKHCRAKYHQRAVYGQKMRLEQGEE